MPYTINNKKPDAFSEAIRKKLENHTMPINASSWNVIAAGIKFQKRRIIPFWFWLSGGAAVAGLALFFTFQPLSQSTDFNITAKSNNIQQETFGTKQVVKQKIKEINSAIKNPNRPLAIKQQSVHKLLNSNAVHHFSDIYTVNNDTTESNKIKYSTVVDNLLQNEALSATNRVTNDSILKNSKTSIIPNSLTTSTIDESISISKVKHNWLLAAAFGSGGSLDFSGKNNFLNGNVNLSTGGTNFTSIFTPNDFSQKSFMAPISFGLIIRKNLDKTISLESGLVYTYLLSIFENSGMQHSDAKLHLHYIGIPLNLVGRLCENSNWELYLSAGTMAEKGIQSVYIQNQYAGNQVITTIAKTNINGLQWSVNGAVGVTYKVQRNWGIYFEPKLSYFFDNNQPISARTENQVVIGVTAGVRYQLK